MTPRRRFHGPTRADLAIELAQYRRYNRFLQESLLKSTKALQANNHFIASLRIRHKTRPSFEVPVKDESSDTFSQCYEDSSIFTVSTKAQPATATRTRVRPAPAMRPSLLPSFQPNDSQGNLSKNYFQILIRPIYRVGQKTCAWTLDPITHERSVRFG